MEQVVIQNKSYTKGHKAILVKVSKNSRNNATRNDSSRGRVSV